jgi:hypothetical protein
MQVINSLKNSEVMMENSHHYYRQLKNIMKFRETKVISTQIIKLLNIIYYIMNLKILNPKIKNHLKNKSKSKEKKSRKLLKILLKI